MNARQRAKRRKKHGRPPSRNPVRAAEPELTTARPITGNIAEESRPEAPRQPVEQHPHKVADFITGIVVGTVSTIVFQVLLDFTPLYRTHLQPSMAAPVLKVGRGAQFDGAEDIIWTAQLRVMNRGLRPGHIGHIEITPWGVAPVPKVDVVGFDHDTFWPWRPRTITINALTTYAPASMASFPTCFDMNVYDDTGQFAFRLIWHGYSHPLAKIPATAAAACANL